MLSSCGGHGNPRSLPQEHHGRCGEQQGGEQEQDGFLLREARASPSPSSSSFLGSTSSSSGGGGQMLSFSSPNGTAGWGSFPPGCSDVEPRRCRRTDGKKWRCSRDAVGDQKYCERHINRGRHRSRKHVEGRKATLTIAEPPMVIAAGVSSRGHTVARQKQVKSSAATVSDPFSRQSNRKFLEKQAVVDQLSPMDSFDFSSTQSSPNYDNAALSPLKLHHDHDESYIRHGAGSSSEKGNMMHESRLTVSKETLDDGPLGEVFKRKNCQSASTDILTDKWTESPNSHCPSGVLQMATKFNSMSSGNTVNSGGTAVENLITDNGYLTARMMNPHIVPTLL